MKKRILFTAAVLFGILAANVANSQMIVVKKGDTVSGLAKIYNTTVSAIQELNYLKDVSKIYIGQHLKVGNKDGVVGAISLPTDNYDTYITAPVAASDSSIFVNALPTGITDAIYTIYASDGRTISEKIYCTGKSSSPNKLTGCLRGVSASPNSDGSITETAGTGVVHSQNTRIAITDNINYTGKALAILNGYQQSSSTQFIIGTGVSSTIKIFLKNTSATSTSNAIISLGGYAGWTDDGTNTYLFKNGGSGLVAGTGISINSSAITLNQDTTSTSALGINNSGKVVVVTSTSAGTIKQCADGLCLATSTAITWSGAHTFTATTSFSGRINASSTDATPNFLVDGMAMTSSTVTSTISGGLAVNRISPNPYSSTATTTIVGNLQVNGALSYSGTKYGGTSSCANESTYTNTGTLTVTCGFQPSFINVFSVIEYDTGGGSSQATRSSFGFYDCTTQHYIGQNDTAAVAGTGAVGKINTIQGGSTTWDMTASCTATGFTVTATKTGSPGTIAVMGVGIR